MRLFNNYSNVAVESKMVNHSYVDGRRYDKFVQAKCPTETKYGTGYAGSRPCGGFTKSKAKILLGFFCDKYLLDGFRPSFGLKACNLGELLPNSWV
jgi:hypothetical protein